MIVLFLHFSKSNFKVGGSATLLGGTGGKIRLNVEKMVIFSGLKVDDYLRKELVNRP